MRARIKIILCLLLALFAIISLGAVLAGLGLLPEEDVSASAEQGYLLREWNGYVGVFCPPDAESPVMITDIPVRALPISDRLSLAGGIGAEDYGSVIRLLEDFGS
ncbi:MAG: hypothetical protein LUH36_07010 [Oscillospiraceae bacterium]|nr:hypothetical protein [Oscillospiraceae bacterium]